jgi:hypothetical protein
MGRQALAQIGDPRLVGHRIPIAAVYAERFRLM